MNSLEYLEKQIKKLENKINELESKGNNKYKRQRYNDYYSLLHNGNISRFTDYKDEVDNFCYGIGNHFETKEQAENYKEKLKSLNLAEENYKDIKFYTSGTCEKCMNTGYIGRIPVFEIIYFDESLKNMLAQKKEIKQNFKTLLENAMDKAKEGLTSLDEIMRQLWEIKKKKFYFSLMN